MCGLGFYHFRKVEASLASITVSGLPNFVMEVQHLPSLVPLPAYAKFINNTGALRLEPHATESIIIAWSQSPAGSQPLFMSC